MADKIDSALYQGALKQVAAKLRRESKPVSALAQAIVEQTEQETAKQMFANAWHTAKGMQIDQNAQVAKRKPTVEVPKSKLLGRSDLPETARKRLEESHRMRQQMAAELNKGNHAALDEVHERTILGMFTRLGIDQATAEKVVVAMKEIASRT